MLLDVDKDIVIQITRNNEGMFIVFRLLREYMRRTFVRNIS